MLILMYFTQKGDEAVQALKSSSDFSTAFNMLLNSNVGGQKDDGKGQYDDFATFVTGKESSMKHRT